MRCSARRSEIAGLDPERDAARIVHLLACYEFPWDMTRSLEIALLRTFSVPAVSALLDRTGEFRTRAQQRYDDTDLLVSELLEWGYDSERGRRALRRINQQHGRFAIANEEFLYVLSTFVYEPIRWNRRFGWRVMSETERLALFHFWRAVGTRMGIRDIPDQYGTFEKFNQRYERMNIRYADSNHRVGNAVLDMFCSWFPTVLQPLVRTIIISLLDDDVIDAFGFEKPARLVRIAVEHALRFRAALLIALPKRRRPRLRTLARHRSYPHGYSIDKLGPPGT
jgi:hypothetical protein